MIACEKTNNTPNLLAIYSKNPLRGIEFHKPGNIQVIDVFDKLHAMFVGNVGCVSGGENWLSADASFQGQPFAPLFSLPHKSVN